MEVIKRKHTHPTREAEYTIYTLEEAVEKGLNVIPWRDTEPGDEGKWALSDDGYVGEILDVKVYKRKDGASENAIISKHVRTAFGTSFARAYNPEKESTRMNFLENKRLGNYTRMKRVSWKGSFIKSHKTKAFVTAYVHMVLYGHINWHKLGLILRRDDKIPTARAKKTIKMKEVRAMVKDEMLKALELSGIDAKFVFDKFKKAAQIAETEGQADNLRKVAVDLARIMGMEPKQKQITETEQYDFTQVEEGVKKRAKIKFEREQNLLEEGDEGKERGESGRKGD